MGTSQQALFMPAGAVATFATWNPADKAALVTLSNGNLTATATNDGGATFQSGRATRGIAGGAKKFWSAKVTILPTSGNMAIGWAVDTTSLTGFMGTGSATDGSAAQYKGDAHFFVIGASQAVTNAWSAVNDVIDFAVDHTAELTWQRVNGGVWNAGGTADPATGLGGFSFAGLTGGQSPALIYPAYQLVGDAGGTGQVILNSGASAYTFAPPSGYGNV